MFLAFSDFDDVILYGLATFILTLIAVYVFVHMRGFIKNDHIIWEKVTDRPCVQKIGNIQTFY